MDRVITIAPEEQCTGCGACKEICPHKAISFLPDGEGFPSPVIDEKKCVHCGLCERTCPSLYMPESQAIHTAYAAQIKDKDILKESTSGGLFTAFSREIFRRSGVVYGCIWDDHYNAVVCKAENEKEIEPMRGSKYVWSWAGDTYPEIKAYLEEGRTVMFTGLPCQVAGLKKYLHKDYERLYLVDFFCGGVPSPYAFHEYLKSISKGIPSDELNIKFRDKDKYGVGVHISYNTARGRKTQTYIGNPYYFSFYSKLVLRPSCYHCQYRYSQRVEDITIGDFWGVEKFHPEMDIRSGISALMINTVKGAELFDAVKDNLELCETCIDNIANENNLTLGDKQVIFHAPRFRNLFFDALKEKGWKSAERKYLFNGMRLKLWIKTKLPKNFMKVLHRLIRKGKK